MGNELEILIAKLTAFRDARDWQQFHSLKNLMVSLAIESSEALELVQWRNDEEIDEALENPEFVARLEEECADVFLYILMICEKSNIDLLAAAQKKITNNEKKYPVSKSKGSAKSIQSSMMDDRDLQSRTVPWKSLRWPLPRVIVLELRK